MRLKDKVAVVTGSAKGLGKAMAVALVKEGAKVAISDIDTEALDATAKEIEALGGECVATKTSVAVKSDVKQMIEKVASTFGKKIDILINNAGGSLSGMTGLRPSIEELEEEHWDLVVDTNLKGTFFCCQAAFPYMKEHGGTILNVSSMAARATMYPTGVSLSDWAYSAAKGGIIGLTKRLAFDLGHYGIRVNATAPGINLGGTTTGKRFQNRQDEEQRKQYFKEIPLGRLGNADDIVGVMLFLVTEESAYVTGQVVDVSGGIFTG